MTMDRCITGGLESDIPKVRQIKMSSPDNSTHEFYMRECLNLARSASDSGEVPVGAIVVNGDRIISKASNAQIGECDPTAHAEIIALRGAAQATGNYRLPGCTLYSTVEPCLMCAGALLHARVVRVVYGAPEPRAGAVGGEVDYFNRMKHVHKLEVVGGILEAECRSIMQDFFKARRAGR